MELRACERLDPLAVFGVPWSELPRHKQDHLVAYAQIRMNEERRDVHE